MHCSNRTAETNSFPGSQENPDELATIGKLDAYAKDHVAPTAMRTVTVSEATIRFAAEVRSKRLPEIDKWLKTHHR